MYNDVDNDLQFNDTIDGEELFLFSNTKSSSTSACFLQEDEDDHHLRNQHNVAGTSAHLQVDVDDILLNTNFLEQPNCDQPDDPLFWGCKDITVDHLNEFLPQSQLNLSNSNGGNTINNNNSTTCNNNNTNQNHISHQTSQTNGNSNNCNAADDNTASNSVTTSTNITNGPGSSISINQLQLQASLHHPHSQLIPIQHLQSQQQQQQEHRIVNQHQHLAPQSQLTISDTQQIRIQNVSNNHQATQVHVEQHQSQTQHVTTVAQQLPLHVLPHTQHPQFQQQGLHQDQFQTKWVTIVPAGDQYQTFGVPQGQFFDKIPQHQLIHASINTLPATVNVVYSPHDQTSLIQPQSNQDHSSIKLDQRNQQNETLQLASSSVCQTTQANTQTRQSQQVQIAPQATTTTTLPPFQQLVPNSKNKIVSTTNNNVSVTTLTVTSSNSKEVIVKPKPKEKQTRLDCPYCKRSFSKNFDLQQHMRCHTGEKPFQCIVCGRGFAQKSNVKKHMQAHKVWPEGPNNPSMPLNTGTGARSRNNSASSSQETRDDECMQENEVSRINTNNDGLNIGSSNDKKNDAGDIFAENRYSCSYCQFNGRTYFELKSHLTIHKREKVFKCIVSSCGKTFSGSDLQGFLSHVTGHKDLIYHCHLCSGKFYSLDEFGEHQKNHSSSQAKKGAHNPQPQQQPTGLSVLNQNSYSNLRQQNQQGNSALQPQQNQRHVNIQQQSQQVHQHQQSNNQKSSQVFSNQPPKNNTKYFRCSKCMNRYTTQMALDHHLSISTHNFPCTECNKVFPCERYLRRHLITHTTVQHVCSFCDKQFKNPAYLKLHAVTHSGEKPFRCNLCEAAFNRRDKLNRHKLTHETVKKFKCPFKLHIGCTKEFNRPDKLKAHVQTHSGVRPHPCDACSRTFSRLSRLREHKKLHHDDDNNNEIKPGSGLSMSSASSNASSNNGTSNNSENERNTCNNDADIGCGSVVDPSSPLEDMDFGDDEIDSSVSSILNSATAALTTNASTTTGVYSRSTIESTSSRGVELSTTDVKNDQG